jgi:hypothetical protein
VIGARSLLIDQISGASIVCVRRGHRFKRHGVIITEVKYLHFILRKDSR